MRSNSKTMTPTQVLGEVFTHDIFKQSQREAHGLANDDGKKVLHSKLNHQNRTIIMKMTMMMTPVKKWHFLLEG